MCEGAGGQAAALFQGKPAVLSGGYGAFIVFGVYNDGDRIVILRGGTHH